MQTAYKIYGLCILYILYKPSFTADETAEVLRHEKSLLAKELEARNASIYALIIIWVITHLMMFHLVATLYVSRTNSRLLKLFGNLLKLGVPTLK